MMSWGLAGRDIGGPWRGSQTVSFGTNAGCPEIKAFSVSKAGPKMEAKWWPSQRWGCCRHRPETLSQTRHRFRLPFGLLRVREPTRLLRPRCVDSPGAPMARRRKATVSSAKPGNEMVDTRSRRFVPPALLKSRTRRVRRTSLGSSPGR